MLQSRSKETINKVYYCGNLWPCADTTLKNEKIESIDENINAEEISASKCKNQNSMVKEYSN